MKMANSIIKMKAPLQKETPTENDEMLPKYFYEADSWFKEKYELSLNKVNFYKLINAGLFIGICLCILCFCFLFPLKQVTYKLIEVNESTGEIQSLNEVDAGKYSNDWLVTRYLIKQYVLNHESYNYDDVKRPFNIILAMSSPEIAGQYKNYFMDTNPNSPINIYAKDKFITTENINVSKLNDNTALVRFETYLHDKTTNEAIKKTFSAVVKWKYEDVKEKIEDEDKDPLGFKVTYYQSNPVLEN